jgi:hypothetical protein
MDMDCRTFANYMDKHLGEEVEKTLPDDLLEDLRRHRRQCRGCRQQYPALPDADKTPDAAEPQPLRKHKPASFHTHTKGSVEFPDISAPAEYKDEPLAFTFHLNGREEKVKVTEPEVDVPMPEGSRLVVLDKDKDACLCDVVFEFTPQNDLPYELRFRVMSGVTYAAGHVLAFGSSPEEDENLRNEYRKTIVERGSIRADIVMVHAKARLSIVYRPFQQ